MIYETKQILERLAGAELPFWPTIQQNIRATVLAKGQVLFRADDPQANVWFVRNGAIKMVYVTADGAEWIKGFVTAGTVFTSLSALQAGGVSTFSAIAICHAEVEMIPYAHIAKMAEKHLEWQAALTNAFRQYGIRKELRERDLLIHSAEERYRKPLKESPDLVAILPQKDIASYIRVTPVALSRIKNRLARFGDV